MHKGRIPMSKIKNRYTCSLELVMDLIGGKWKLMILWYLMDGTKRFGDLRRYLPAITQKMLAQQLRELEEYGIISRKVYAVVPPKVEYTMTEYGLSLTNMLQEMCQWATRYAEDKGIQLIPVKNEERC
jgi:DNA-binding HxlR family transcriptional regulator